MEACTTKFVSLKDLLNSFIDSCGIKVNYSKSMIVPINVSKEKNEDSYGYGPRYYQGRHNLIDRDRVDSS